ncbi:START domain-containing protein [Mucilaginibacter myungsuensis]|uniref:Lipid-binding protein n=1 Tax=Mucilaginibacter myungsuensis TaxID=649104 RepID=A0A929PVB8_9SPHI|nr:START domain-containing protein [Mucilaginibacter myungsuensis]MBE9660846.1 lipid-binding protein [Mucilaginibacter myungsuensis]MDN3600893.1 START domain-containing protein [Mucilaginibacter myungsuensis]
MYKFFPFLLLIIITTNTSAQNWKLTTDADGMKIYMAEVAGSKIKAIKVELELNATQSQLVAVLMDANTCVEWVYGFKSSKLIRQVSPSESYYYAEVNLPWPAENRDYVAHLTATQNPDTKVVTIDAPAVLGFVPIKKGIVRVERSVGKWVISPLSADKIHVVYTLQLDPGGNIPAWLVNTFATQAPTNSFKKLKEQLKKPAYRDASLPFIKD